MHLQLSELSRIVRIRSWKELAVIIVGSVVYVACDYLLAQFVPQLAEKTRRTILSIGLIILLVIVLFAIDA